MTEREKFEKWLNTLDKQTLVTMAAKQAKTINLMQAAKATSNVIGLRYGVCYVYPAYFHFIFKCCGQLSLGNPIII